jgi:ribosome maturation protein SDO1
MTQPQIVKYKAGKTTYEVLTKQGTVLKYRKKQIGSLDNVLMSEEVFKDYRKGERAGIAELKAAFGMDDMKQILATIIEKGDLQLTDAERKEILEKKRREIVNYIAKYYVDPKTKLPHPVVRIENALETLKIRIDPDIPADKQAHEIVKKFPGVLAVKKIEIEGTITIPHAYIGACTNVMMQYVKVISENYDEKGCEYKVTMIPGDYNALLAELNKITKGDFNFELDTTEMAATSEESTEKKSRGNKPKKK